MTPKQGLWNSLVFIHLADAQKVTLSDYFFNISQSAPLGPKFENVRGLRPHLLCSNLTLSGPTHEGVS